MDQLSLEIITLSRVMVADKVDMVEAKGAYGEFGILPGHTQFLTTIDVGEIRYMKGGETYFLATGAGFMEVNENRVAFLVDTGEFAEEIDVDRAREEAERAEEALKIIMADASEYRKMELALLKAIARIGVAGKMPTSRRPVR